MDSWPNLPSLKLKIRVLLLGVHDTDDEDLHEKQTKLEAYLSKVFPSYDAPVLSPEPTEEAARRKLVEAYGEHSRELETFKIPYAISYDVKYMSKKDGQDEYVRVLAEEIQEVRDNMGRDNTRKLVVPIARVSEKLEKWALQQFDTTSSDTQPIFGDTEVTLLVANTDLPLLWDETKGSALENDEKIVLSFTADPQSPATCTRSWVGRKRVLIADLSATDCDSEIKGGSFTGSGAQATTHRGTANIGNGRERDSIVRRRGPVAAKAPGSEGGTSGHAVDDGAPDERTLFHVELSSLVISATRAVLAPALPSIPETGDEFSRIIVPIIVFRGGSEGPDEKNEDVDSLVDIRRVKAAMKAVGSPAQEVLFIKPVHHALDEHPQVALALARSLVTHVPRDPASMDESKKKGATVLQHVDSAGLLRELKATGYGLPSSLLSYMGEVPWEYLLHLDVALKESEISESNRDFRVLPVFVLCLGSVVEPSDSRDSTQSQEQAKFFEGHLPFAVEPGGDAVVILQSKGSTAVQPSRGHGSLPMPRENDATQAVVAGLLQALFGTTPPNRLWLPGRQESQVDLVWAHGYHPFAPFGISGIGENELGELVAHVARRNAVTSRAVAAASLLSETGRMLENFVSVLVPSRLVSSSGLAAASFSDPGITSDKWKSSLTEILASARLPPYILNDVTAAYDSYTKELASFKAAMKDAPGLTVAQALESMQELRKRAITVRRQVVVRQVGL